MPVFLPAFFQEPGSTTTWQPERSLQPAPASRLRAAPHDVSLTADDQQKNFRATGGRRNRPRRRLPILRRGAPSDQIQVGFIGLGGQGTSRLKEFMRHPDVVAAAVCDLDQKHLDAAAAAVEKAQGHKPDSVPRLPKTAGAQRPGRRDGGDAGSLARPARDPCLPGGKRRVRGEAAGVFHRRRPRHGRRGAEEQAHHPDGEPHPQRSPHLPARGGGDPVRRAGPDPSRRLFAGDRQQAHRQARRLPPRRPSSITSSGWDRRRSARTIRCALISPTAISGITRAAP